VPERRVAIVGGGIAGLAAARALHLQGQPFVVLEASDRWGGIIRTVRVGGFLIEGGPDSLLAQKPEGIGLCHELGLRERLVPTNPRDRTVYVLRRGRLHVMPEGMILTVPTRIGPLLRSSLFSWPGKLRMGLDLALPGRRGTTDESIARFLRRRFGGEMLDRLGGPLLAGIHAGDPERLSLRATFPRLSDLEARSGSLIRGLRRLPPARPSPELPSAFVSLRDGLVELVNALVGSLPADALRLRSQVVEIAPAAEGYRIRLETGETVEAASVLVAVPARQAAGLVAPLLPDAAALLGTIRFASTATVVLGYRRVDVAHPLDGYGLLVLHGEGLRTGACSFYSTKFPGRVPEGHVMLRGFVGGIHEPEMLEKDDATLVATVHREMGSVLGLSAEPVLSRVFRWPEGTPQMEVGHLDRIAALERALTGAPGLFLAGSGLRGTGIPDTIADAQRTAVQAASSMRAPF
jgi:oxygen-dependent protoporphyrinogen oxidase